MVNNDVLFFIPDFGNLSLSFFLVNVGKSSLIWLIFSKNQHFIFVDFHFCFSILYFINFHSNLYFLSFVSCTLSLLFFFQCRKVELQIIFFFFKFLTVLGLCFCALAFSSCGEWGLLFVVVCGLLIAMASLVVEQGL